jgi:ABC-type antimicrobial peptide transport system permease subunit
LYIFLKIFLGAIGFLSASIFLLILSLTIKFIFFSDPVIGREILNYESICGFENTTSLANEKCQNLMTIYWLLVVGFIFFIISLITIYPFFKMSKKKIKN